jgi:cytochrome c oxidase subunit 3
MGAVAESAVAPGPAEHVPWVGEQYDTAEQQRDASTLGMWVFLMTEVMLFGGFFVSYTTYRVLYPQAWAEGARHLNLLLGAVDTAVLLVSNLTMALAIYWSKVGKQRWLMWSLGATALLGMLFLSLKGLEWSQHADEGLVPGFGFHVDSPNARAVQMFFLFYFGMTGLHAIHLTIAVGVVLAAMWVGRHGTFATENSAPVEVIGLYWHFVDVVWVFLYPLLYLIGLGRAT